MDNVADAYSNSVSVQFVTGRQIASDVDDAGCTTNSDLPHGRELKHSRDEFVTAKVVLGVYPRVVIDWKLPSTGNVIVRLLMKADGD